jgi:predicted nucleic acid-binding protein
VYLLDTNVVSELRKPRPHVDALIAATSIQHGLVVVTRNVRDFAPFGVETVDPFATARPAR